MRSGERVVRLPVLGAPRSHLLDALLAEQQELSAVERFARRPDDGGDCSTYRERLPASPPGPGQQYAFEVDLDRCSGCKACVTACHGVNQLDDGEAWRRVERRQSRTSPVERTVTASCHHCVEPACLRGCPAGAYAKDAATGIVSHREDACLGCQYCLWTCPYEVPQASPARGVVRKCDMCSARLAADEPPACVQACPSQAIAIRVVDLALVPRRGALLPGAAPSSLTAPSTIYRSREPLPDDLRPLEPATTPAASHLPLVGLLLLTQLSVGSLLVQHVSPDPPRPLTALVAAVAAALGLATSVLHLGRPRLAWRALLGLRTSWLSREVLAFGLHVGAAAGYALALSSLAPAWLARLAGPLGLTALLLGLAGTVCSVLVYTVTGRPGFRLARTGPRFLVTTLGLGVLAVAATSETHLGLAHAALVAGLAAAWVERRRFFAAGGRA